MTNSKHELKKILGERLREFRKKKGLTQRQLSVHFEVGMANYSRIERGEVFPNAEILCVLRTEFNLSLDWLLLGNGEMIEGAADNLTYIKMESYGPDVRQMLEDIDKIPVLKHAVLTFYMEYKLSKAGIIEDFTKKKKA